MRSEITTPPTQKQNFFHPSILTGIIFLIAIQVSGQPGEEKAGNRHSDHHPKHRMDPHWTLPGLTDEQKTKMENLNLEFQKNILPKENMIREKEAKLVTTFTLEKINQAEADRLIEEIGLLRTEIRKERIRTDLKIREQLTEEQKVIFNNHWAHRKGFENNKSR
jgi:Spy/CpxP family protein refolding chaperone